MKFLDSLMGAGNPQANPLGAGNVPMSGIGSPGGLSQQQLVAGLAGNPGLAGINPGMVTGASDPTAPAGPGALPTFSAGLAKAFGSGGGGGSTPEKGVNAGLQIGQMIPGPQQPFVAAASALAPTVEGIFGGKGGPAPALPSPTPLQRGPGGFTPPSTAPVTPPSLGTIAAPTGSSPSFADLLKLIASMRGG